MHVHTHSFKLSHYNWLYICIIISLFSPNFPAAPNLKAIIDRLAGMCDDKSNTKKHFVFLKYEILLHMLLSTFLSLNYSIGLTPTQLV